MARLPTLAARVQTLAPRAAPTEPSYGQGRGGRPWRRKRDQILKRDRYMCQCEDCQGKRLIAHEVDHIVPLSQGGSDDDSNLRAINRDCHKAKTQREARYASGQRVGG
jgi:5-methylcytosine-specific restriction protein A